MKSKTITSRVDLSEHGCLSFCIDSDVTIKAISRISIQMYGMVYIRSVSTIKLSIIDFYLLPLVWIFMFDTE